MKVRRSVEILIFLGKNGFVCDGRFVPEILIKRRTCCNTLWTKTQRRYASSTTSRDQIASTKVESNTSVSSVRGPEPKTRFKTVASVMYEMVKKSTPSIQITLPSWIAKRLPFSPQTNTADNVSNTSKTASHEGTTDMITKKMAAASLFLSALSNAQSKTRPAEKAIPKWKIKRKPILQESLDARTKHVVSAVFKSTLKSSLLTRLGELSYHLFHYPQSKSLATREGAVSLLMRLKHSHRDDDCIQAQIREALTLLGYTEPLPGRGVRILSIDGGGTRGLLALRILRHLEEKVGRPIHESFDYICGVSTGAILAILIGGHKKSLAEVEQLYRRISSEVFQQDRSSGLSGLLWSHSYYNTEKWEKILKEEFGEAPMIKSAYEPGCPKVSAVSSVVNHGMEARPFVFRNYTLHFRNQSLYNGTFRHKTWEAVRATSAAPGYFGEFVLEDNIHQDGGLLVNNPCAVGIHEAKCIWPDAQLVSVISIGTGRCQPLDVLDGSDPGSTSWKQKLVKIIDSATDTERVHTILHDLLPPKVYYRFNPYLNEVHGLDETDPRRWDQMLDDVDMYIRKNERKFAEAANSINISRTNYQQAQDWINQRRSMMYNMPVDWIPHKS